MRREKLTAERIAKVFEALDLDSKEKREKYRPHGETESLNRIYLPFLRLSNESVTREGEKEDAELG